MCTAHSVAARGPRACRHRLRSDVSPGHDGYRDASDLRRDALLTPRDGAALLQDVRRELDALRKRARSQAPSPPVTPPPPPPPRPAVEFRPGTGPNTAGIMSAEEAHTILRNMLVSQHRYVPMPYTDSAAMVSHRRTHGTRRPNLRALYVETILQILVTAYDDMEPPGYEPFWVAVNLFDRAVNRIDRMRGDARLWTLIVAACTSVALSACDMEPPSFVWLSFLIGQHHSARQIRKAQGVVVNMVDYDVFAVCANDILGAYVDALPHVRTAQGGHVGEVAHFYAMLAMFSVDLAHRAPSQIAYAALHLACETHDLATPDALDAESLYAMGHDGGAPHDAVDALRTWYGEWRTRWAGAARGAALRAPAHIIDGMRKRAPDCPHCGDLWAAAAAAAAAAADTERTTV